MAGGSVITDAGGKVSHPAIHRRFDNRLAELPLRMFQRRFGYADPRSGGSQVVVAVFRAVLTFSRSSAEMAFCDRLRRRRASLAALLCSACAFATSARAFASCARAFSTAMRWGVVDGKQYFPGFDPLVIGYVQLQNTAGDLRVIPTCSARTLPSRVQGD